MSATHTDTIREALPECPAHHFTAEQVAACPACQAHRKARAALDALEADRDAWEERHQDALNAILEQKRRLAAAERELPETWYADLPFERRLSLFADHWRALVCVNAELENELASRSVLPQPATPPAIKPHFDDFDDYKSGGTPQPATPEGSHDA